MSYLEEVLQRVEESINSVLPRSVDLSWLNRIAGIDGTEANADSLAAWADLFLEPGRELLGRGGKRWRPLVSVLTCEALGGGTSADPLVPLVEIAHNGTLIVDDIEDNSLLRRGKPAVHIKYGTDLSVNMGNLMYFLSTVLVESPEIADKFSVQTRLGFISDYNRAMRKVHFGQGYDILWHREKTLFPDIESYLAMCRLKTGSLASLSAETGVRAALQRKEDLGPDFEKQQKHTAEEFNNIHNNLSEAWEELGTGFQILDDVQNLSTGIPGKDWGDDIVEGKKSLPVIIHVQENPGDREKLALLFKRAGEDSAPESRKAVEETIGILEGSGAVKMAKETGDALLISGKEKMGGELPGCRAKTVLTDLIDGFIDKMK